MDKRNYFNAAAFSIVIFPRVGENKNILLIDIYQRGCSDAVVDIKEFSLSIVFSSLSYE